MNKIVIREVTVAEVMDNFALLEAHWEEVALNKSVMLLKPDLQKYLQLESNNTLLLVGAYCGLELVGYSVNFLLFHPHYADLHFAANDLLFVDVGHRKGRVGLQLIRETEERAKARGAMMMTWHAKPDTALAALLPRLNYGVQDIILSKEL